MRCPSAWARDSNEVRRGESKNSGKIEITWISTTQAYPRHKLSEYTAQERIEGGYWRPGRPAGPGQRLAAAIEQARVRLADESDVAPIQPPPSGQLVVDLRSPYLPASEISDRDDDYGLGTTWGSQWENSAQGWVAEQWRPVVTTTSGFPAWEVDTYLGVIAGEAAVHSLLADESLLGAALDEGRDVAQRGLIDSAVAKGAHAVVGASVRYTQVGGRLLVTMTGTAVTLRDRS